jgi:integrase
VTRRRRGHGEGTIYHRPDGRWEAVVDLGWQDGKRRRKYLYGRTRREVAEKLARALKARQEHVPFVSERTTVEQYLAAWLELIRPTIQDSTWRRYEQYVRLHLVPSIGKVRLVKLQPEHLQRMYGERIGKGMSRTSAVHPHRAIHRALALAVRWGHVPRNVAALVEPPRMPHYEFTTLSPEQARTFMQALRGRRLEALYLVAITTGMREGELLGLRWSDVDLTARSIRVRRSRARHQGAGGETKTPESRRQVVLPDLAVRRWLPTRSARQPSDSGGGRSGTTSTWSSRIPSGGRSLPRTSCAGTSTRCWRPPGCRASASTTCGTRWPRCCSAEGCTPRSSARCSATPSLASRLTCTRTSPLPCSTTRPATSTRCLVVSLVVRSAAWRTKPRVSPRSSGDRATVS